MRTNDMKTAVRCYEGLEFGMVGVNDWAVAATEGPFPGGNRAGWATSRAKRVSTITWRPSSSASVCKSGV